MFWQRTLIRLARSPKARAMAESSKRTRALAARFVGGETLDAALDTARDLMARGMTSSFFLLGEYVDDPAEAASQAAELAALPARVAAAGLEAHISVDPTQIGAQQSWQTCGQRAEAIDRAVQAAPVPKAAPRRVLMLDMEDHAVCQATLDLHDRLAGQGLPVAVTLQAYLHRTPQDVVRLARSGAFVRLVKGAFAERKEVALTRRAEIDAAYRVLAGELLGEDARGAGCYPAFATHDRAMVDHVLELARERSIPAKDFEFELLYGVRPELARQIVAEGWQVRLYLPYGTAWWPYAARRVGENPRNALMVARAIFGK